MRCRSLAEAALRRGLAVRIYLAETEAADEDARALAETPAAERLRSLQGIEAIRPWRDWKAADAGAFSVLDTPFDKRRWLAEIARSDSRAVVIDDDRVGDYEPLVILPGLHHTPARDDLARGRLVGPRYAILSPAHLQTSALPPADRDTLLLSMGGADPHHFTARLAPWIDQTLAAAPHVARGLQRVCVLGPAFADPAGHVDRMLGDAGWRVHHGLDPARFAALMARSSLAIIGFGTSVTELAWHGTPQLFVPHAASDVPVARRLEQRGLGTLLGHGAALDRVTTTNRLGAALAAPGTLAARAQRARAALEDGRGAERILDQMLARDQTREQEKPSNIHRMLAPS